MTSSCLLCRSPCLRRSHFCTHCLNELPTLPPGVCRCSLHVTAEAGTLCGQCLGRPPAFSRVISAYAYCYPIDQLLIRYKYQRRLALEPALHSLWRRQLPETGVDALVPIPMHWQRFIWRGFNQAARLAQGVSKEVGVPVMPVLSRQRRQPAQQGLDAPARRSNLRDAFRLKGDVSGLRLALIDDVVTTGATAEAASACLLAGGAADVQVWSLFRTL